MAAGRCDACGYGTEVSEYPTRGYDATRHVPEAATRRLCALCAATAGSTVTALYRTGATNEDVVRTVCHVGNEILAAIGNGPDMVIAMSRLLRAIDKEDTGLPAKVVEDAEAALSRVRGRR